ncbi:MAG: hypothetical protein SGI72_04070 [Planctomycetota bacterium]|nr:hypothetical protein [Planctomycetota bacterium]
MSGSSEYPVTGLPSVSALGAATPGATLHYQVWYRDSNAFCTAAVFNLSNGLSATWAF